MQSGGKINATQAPRRGGELDSMRVEYCEPLAAWIFPRQGTPGSYAGHIGWMDVLLSVCLFLKKTSRPRRKKQTHNKKRTTNSTGRVHNDQHRAACTPNSYFTAARNPAACILSLIHI